MRCRFRKIRDTITSRMIRFFLDQSKKDLEKYLVFHQNYKMFITEGVLSEDTQDKRVNRWFELNRELAKFAFSLNISFLVKTLDFRINMQPKLPQLEA